MRLEWDMLSRHGIVEFLMKYLAAESADRVRAASALLRDLARVNKRKDELTETILKILFCVCLRVPNALPCFPQCVHETVKKTLKS
jgi:hypothetical protein